MAERKIDYVAKHGLMCEVQRDHVLLASLPCTS